MLRRPRSTLFPYTTLFRSVQIGRAGGQRVGAEGLDGEALEPGRLGFRIAGIDGAEIAANGHGAEVEAGAVDVADVDRKSTRLNSSHVAISYAVFCLKKKIK